MSHMEFVRRVHRKERMPSSLGDPWSNNQQQNEHHHNNNKQPIYCCVTDECCFLLLYIIIMYFIVHFSRRNILYNITINLLLLLPFFHHRRCCYYYYYYHHQTSDSRMNACSMHAWTDILALDLPWAAQGHTKVNVHVLSSPFNSPWKGKPGAELLVNIAIPSVEVQRVTQTKVRLVTMQRKAVGIVNVHLIIVIWWCFCCWSFCRFWIRSIT